MIPPAYDTKFQLLKFVKNMGKLYHDTVLEHYTPNKHTYTRAHITELVTALQEAQLELKNLAERIDDDA